MKKENQILVLPIKAASRVKMFANDNEAKVNDEQKSSNSSQTSSILSFCKRNK